MSRITFRKECSRTFVRPFGTMGYLYHPPPVRCAGHPAAPDSSGRCFFRILRDLHMCSFIFSHKL